MSPFRPPRIRGFSDVGFHRYFLTICVHPRRPAFTTNANGGLVIDHLLTIARGENFAVIAYCVMPDHVHAVLEGESANADLRRFVHMWKLVTGHAWRRLHGERLWQEGYYEHVLRDDEDLPAIVRYMLNNPVRAGLVKSPEEYPLLGSSRYRFADLAACVTDWRPPHRRNR